MKNKRHYAKHKILKCKRPQLTAIAQYYISIIRGSLIRVPGRDDP